MKWLRTGGAVLFALLLLSCLPLAGVLLVVRLPMFCCSWIRAVRFLPLAGMCYYLLLASVYPLVLGVPWWEGAVIGVLGMLGGCCLLPDPVTFVLSPRKRRAVLRAIAHQERTGDLRVHYDMVSMVVSEPDRDIVCLPLQSGTKPPWRRFLAVSRTGDGIAEVSGEDAWLRYGVAPWL